MTPKELDKLREEIVFEMTNGWTNSERRNWKLYLEEEIKPYFPTLYEFVKDTTPVRD